MSCPGSSLAYSRKGLTPRDAAIAGGYVHGLAGELAQHEIGDAGAVAGDLLPAYPAPCAY